MPESRSDLKKRFDEKWELDEETGCWVWQASTKGNGYPRISVNNTGKFAHRISYLLHKDPIPDGLQINHRCHNKLCVNPGHIYAGTQSENIQDAREAGWDGGPFGEDHGNSKLNKEDVKEIKRKRRNEGWTQQKLADEFGVHRTTIKSILDCETWVGVEP